MLLLCNIIPSFFHDTTGIGSPLTSHCKVTSSPTLASTLVFDFGLLIVGGTKKLTMK